MIKTKETNKQTERHYQPIRGSCVANQNWYGEIKKREAGRR